MVNEHEIFLTSSNFEEKITTFIRPPYPPKISPKEILIKSNQTKRQTKKKTVKINNNDNKNKNNNNNNNINKSSNGISSNISSSRQKVKRLKSPNAFIIYRNEFVKELRKNMKQFIYHYILYK